MSIFDALPDDITSAIIRNAGYDVGDEEGYKELEGKSARELFGYWCGWTFGDRRWGNQLANVYEALVKAAGVEVEG